MKNSSRLIDSATRSARCDARVAGRSSAGGDKQSLSSVPSVAIAGDIIVGSAPPHATPLVTRRSSKLVDILKALLCYSNNFMAERIGETFGGPEAVRTLTD